MWASFLSSVQPLCWPQICLDQNQWNLSPKNCQFLTQCRPPQRDHRDTCCSHPRGAKHFPCPGMHSFVLAPEDRTSWYRLPHSPCTYRCCNHPHGCRSPRHWRAPHGCQHTCWPRLTSGWSPCPPGNRTSWCRHFLSPCTYICYNHPHRCNCLQPCASLRQHLYTVLKLIKGSVSNPSNVFQLTFLTVSSWQWEQDQYPPCHDVECVVRIGAGRILSGDWLLTLCRSQTVTRGVECWRHKCCDSNGRRQSAGLYPPGTLALLWSGWGGSYTNIFTGALLLTLI